MGAHDINTCEEMMRTISHTDIVKEACHLLELEEVVPGRANLAGVHLDEQPNNVITYHLEMAGPIPGEVIAAICFKAVHSQAGVLRAEEQIAFLQFTAYLLLLKRAADASRTKNENNGRFTLGSGSQIIRLIIAHGTFQAGIIKESILLRETRSNSEPRVASCSNRPLGRSITLLISQSDRQVLNAESTFRNCAFQGCRTSGTFSPDSYGGALYLNNDSLGLGFSSCLFEACWAYGFGGAVYAYWCRSFSMNETSGHNCSAREGSSFTRVRASSGAAGPVEVRDTNIVSCTGLGKATFQCDWSSGSKATCIDDINSSANYAGQSVSAFGFEVQSISPFISAYSLETRRSTVCGSATLFSITPSRAFTCQIIPANYHIIFQVLSICSHH
jgi:hypothetical protein